MQHYIGLIGLGVMGQALARNIAGRKRGVLVYNRTTEKSAQFIRQYGNAYLDYRKHLKSMIQDLKRPRKILLMINAGDPVDQILKQLRPFLDKGDMVIDGGNSHYRDTLRRCAELKTKGIEFVGLGISGGEAGALHGPSLMPGCEPKAWKAIMPLLKKIAAKDFSGNPCVTHVGTDGAGHYVKMVHNGIEYAVMQMMAEAYHMLREMYGLSADKIADVFERFNAGELKSYLFEIALPVLRRKDELTEGNLIDHILDCAGQKGTGQWASVDALQRNAALPGVTEAVFARNLSAFKKERVILGRSFKKPKIGKSVPLESFEKHLKKALYAGMISAYAQGFELIRMAAAFHQWKIDFAEIARIWEGGCIIRADLLHFLYRAFRAVKGKGIHLFAAAEVRQVLSERLADWRETVSLGVKSGVPVPSMASSLSYFESMMSAQLPANFIQGLRDYFGAHTYKRTDRNGTFHTEW
ncbi:NADP-dependent phosphogluconate dehydrogenase [Candidatus Peregrinibacteria bacterium]|nr:NADP-dependent phosphogluconate dehydrogenase [Candidatus Peregrinibacteria bacterium]